MDCDKALELISLRLDGLLTEEEERALDAHLEDCGPCRSLLLELTALRDAMPEEEEPPEGFLDGVMERVRGSKTVTFPVKKTGWKQWKSWAAMAAVFALVIAGAGGLRHTFVPDGNSGGAQPEAAYTASGDQGIAAQAATAPPTALPDEGLSYGDAGGEAESAMDREDRAVDGTLETAPPQPRAATVTPAPTPDPVVPVETAAPAASASLPRMPLLGQSGAGADGAPAEDKAVETQPQEGGPRTAMFSMDRPEATAPAESEEVPGEVKPALTEAEALDAVVEWVFGDSGYEMVREDLDDGETLSCTVTLMDGEKPVTGGTIVYTGEVEDMYSFECRWNDGTEPYHYTVHKTEGWVAWRGEVLIDGEFQP